MNENNEVPLPTPDQKSAKKRSSFTLASFILFGASVIALLMPSIISKFLFKSGYSGGFFSGHAISFEVYSSAAYKTFLKLSSYFRVFGSFIFPAMGFVFGILGLKSSKRVFAILGSVLNGLILLFLVASIFLMILMILSGGS